MVAELPLLRMSSELVPFSTIIQVHIGEKPAKFHSGDFSATFSLMFMKSASGFGSGCYRGLNMP
jgi:hypothetical protein